MHDFHDADRRSAREEGGFAMSSRAGGWVGRRGIPVSAHDVTARMVRLRTSTPQDSRNIAWHRNDVSESPPSSHRQDCLCHTTVSGVTVSIFHAA